MISGWGIAGEGMGKISKSKGGGPMPPMEMIQRYSADAVRYWAATTSPGKDAVISEEKIQMGAKLVTKLWNVARFAEAVYLRAMQCLDRSAHGRFHPGRPLDSGRAWTHLIGRVTAAFDNYEYAQREERRLRVSSGATWPITTWRWPNSACYDPQHPAHAGARYAAASGRSRRCSSCLRRCCPT